MAVATQQSQAGLQQVIQKSDSQLLSIQAQLDQAQKEVIAKAAELAAISSRTATRDQQLHIAAQSVATTRAELEAARLKAKLAEGTLSSDNGADQIKTLSTRLLRLEKEEHDLKVKIGKEAASDTQRAISAQTAIDQVQELITSLHKEQETTQQARQSAFNDLGNVKKQLVMSRLKELHENITRTRTEAASAVQALDAYADEALSSLTEWPSLQSQLRPFLPVYQDASTQLLEAQITLLAGLLNNGKTADIDSFLVSQTLGKFSSITQMLELSERNVYSAFTNGDMQNLREKRDQAEKLLQAYRAQKAR